MKQLKLLAWVVMVAVLICAGRPKPVSADPTYNDLTIIEIKPTGSESLVIENTAASTVNLSDYVLEYFNNKSPANLNIYTSAQALPDFELEPNESILLTGDSAATCGAAVVANLSMSLSDTSGYIQIEKVAAQSGLTTYITQDHAAWTSSSPPSPSDPNDMTIYSVPSATGDPYAVWYRQLSDAAWMRYEVNSTPCSLSSTIVPSSTTTYVQWASGQEAPATIVSLASDGSESAGLPSADIGLAAPQITELLPNPAGTGTDSTDEFIELYNPNNTAFDLSGFVLETGLTTKHKYVFDDGTSLPAKGFSAFYSADTGLTLSNTTGQAALLDPLGNTISQSDVYSSAKDGQAWALANAKWYWTGTPTPGAANVVNQAGGSSSKSKSSTGSGSVKGDSTGSASGGAATFDDATSPAPIHAWTLAGVGAAAVLYACYEYRNDLANHLYRLRRYIEARRTAGK